jgi:hypothetical protein
MVEGQLVSCDIDVFVSIAPTGPPNNLQATPINSTAVNVTWEPPTPDDQNGVIAIYTITYSSQSAMESGSTNTSDTMVILSGLEEFREYNITVTASTTVGSGPERSVTVMTPESGMYCAHFMIAL